MRKVTLTVVGIAGLALLLCGSGEVLAQTDGTVAGGAEASPAELRQSVLQLQSEVAQLRQELALLRAELANVTANIGVGGAGQAGVAPAETPTGVGATTGEAVVDAFYTGTVRSVSNRQLVLQDDNGQPFTLELGAQTRIISNGQRISAQQLEQGTRVLVTVDLLMGRNQATEVTTLPER